MSLAQEMTGTLDSEMVPGRTSCPILGYPSTAFFGADGRAACGWGSIGSGVSPWLCPFSSLRKGPGQGTVEVSDLLTVSMQLPQPEPFPWPQGLGLQKPVRFEQSVSEFNDTKRKSSSHTVPH